jgi:hypothetical protein
MANGLIIFYDEQNGVVIIDEFRVPGFIDDQLCLSCTHRLIYHEDYDSYFCPECNAWTESRCGDPKCVFCVNRPDKPLVR